MSFAVGLGAIGLSTFIVFSYLIFIWWLDRYEREPFWLVMVAFLWGGLGGTALGCTLSLMMSVPVELLFSAVYSNFFAAVIAAPLSEEFTKGLIFVALVFTSHLDNETDGLIYGAAAGLGFAIVENLVYFGAVVAADPETFFFVIVVRTLFTSLVHCISTALLGYTVGYIRHRKLLPLLWLLPIIGFSFAVINHALWNLLAWVSGSGLLSEEMSVGALGLGVIVVIVMALVMFIITQLSLMREQKIIEKYLRDEAQKGVLPMSHAEIIPSWRKRRKRGWLPAHISHKEYVETATLLAFRRYQADTVARRHRRKYQEGVSEFREKLGGLLADGRS